MTAKVSQECCTKISTLRTELDSAKKDIVELKEKLRMMRDHVGLLESLKLKVDALYAVRQIAAPRRSAAHLRPSNHGED